MIYAYATLLLEARHFVATKGEKIIIKYEFIKKKYRFIYARFTLFLGVLSMCSAFETLQVSVTHAIAGALGKRTLLTSQRLYDHAGCQTQLV